MSINSQQIGEEISRERKMIVTRYKEMASAKIKENKDTSYSIAMAPHTIHAVGCFYMAVNHYCVAASRIISRGQQKRVQEHDIVIKDYFHVDEIRNKVWELFEKMNLQNKYRIEIYGEQDYNGQVALLPILVAVWESLKHFESNPSCTAFDIWNDNELFFETVNEIDMNIEGKNVAVAAIIQGNDSEFFFKSDGRDIERQEISDFHLFSIINFRSGSQTFHNNFDLVFGSTNLHSSNFWPHLSWNDDQANVRKESVIRELDDGKDSFTPEMFTFSKQRLEPRNYLNPSQIELQCQAAFLEVDISRNSAIRSYEVQQGGFLLVLRKNQFFSDEWVNEISNKLKQHIKCGKLESIKFQLVKNGKASQPYPVEEELAENDAVSVNFTQSLVPMLVSQDMRNNDEYSHAESDSDW